MTHNRFSDFHFVFTFIQVAHTEFIKVVLTEHSAFKSLSKMSQEQAVAGVIIGLISKKDKSRKERQKRKVGMKPWLKRRENLGFYKTLLAELRLENEYNYKTIYECPLNFEEIFQLIKDDKTKESTKTRDTIPLIL